VAAHSVYQFGRQERTVGPLFLTILHGTIRCSRLTCAQKVTRWPA